MLFLEGIRLGSEFGRRDGEFRPGLEDGVGSVAGPALELGFDMPGERWTGVVG